MDMKFRNVNDAFRGLVEGVHTGSIPTVRAETRNGPVLQVVEPILITYEKPRERVLFNLSRDANCAFHLFEALHMLAGRNDVSPLAYYASNMANYSDDGKTLNGAYGYRWRKAGYRDYEDTYQGYISSGEIDQLALLVSHLKADPTSRRAVLTMWNVDDDLLKIGANPDRSGNFYNPDLKFPPSKDVCCNLNVMFSIREQQVSGMPKAFRNTETGEVKNFFPYRSYLDMTVTNRSNDMIWGMLGANYVHFSFLQEYMASRLGVEVGRYTQFTNNLHVYESNWKPDQWLEAESNSAFYPSAVSFKHVPLVKDPAAFEKELPEFVEAHSGTIEAGEMEDEWTEPFFSEVAGPMLAAFACHKERAYHDALTLVDMIAADDWRIAARGWIERRHKNWEGKR